MSKRRTLEGPEEVEAMEALPGSETIELLGDKIAADFLLQDLPGIRAVREKIIHVKETYDSGNTYDYRLLPQYRKILKKLGVRLAQYELAVFLLSQGVHDTAIAVICFDIGEQIDSSVFERLAESHLTRTNLPYRELRAVDALRYAGEAFNAGESEGTFSVIAQNNNAFSRNVEKRRFSQKLADSAAQPHHRYEFDFVRAYKELMNGDPTPEAINNYAEKALGYGNYQEAEKAFEALTGNKLTREMWQRLGASVFKILKGEEEETSSSPNPPLHRDLMNAARYFASAKDKGKFAEVMDMLLLCNTCEHVAVQIRELMPSLLTPDWYRRAAESAESYEAKFEIYKIGGLLEEARNLWREIQPRMRQMQQDDVGGILHRAGNCFRVLGNTDGLRAVADFYDEIGRYPAAQEIYGSIKFEPPSEFYKNLADYYRDREGNLPEAVKWYRHYEKTRSDREMARDRARAKRKRV